MFEINRRVPLIDSDQYPKIEERQCDIIERQKDIIIRLCST